MAQSMLPHPVMVSRSLLTSRWLSLGTAVVLAAATPGCGPAAEDPPHVGNQPPAEVLPAGDAASAGCGDGVVDGYDQCDDGNTADGDGCDSNCTPTGCGNALVSAGEVCDDGNVVDGDGCDSDCTLTACGNALVSAGEVCDDGNVVDGDGCDSNCTLTACGNALVSAGELCDDGNLVDGDGCDSNCTSTACGNALVSAGELCDDGNLVDGDGCDSNCTLTACGNGVVSPGEQCDDGNATDGDDCDSNCTAAACGNGVVTAGESCDDGNAIPADGCEEDCSLTPCGPGYIVETCYEQAYGIAGDIGLADFDGDGDLDALTAWGDDDIGYVAVHMNSGNGQFSETRLDGPIWPTAAAAGDLDGDGDPDFAVVNAHGSLRVFWNEGGAQFGVGPEMSTGNAPGSVAIADLDGDSYADLVSGNQYGESISVMRNLGAGTFGLRADFPASDSVEGLTLADLDGDGDLDVAAIVGEAHAQLGVLLNDGAGSFTYPSVFALPTMSPLAIRSADMDDDGDEDVVLAGSLGVVVGLNSGQGGFAAQPLVAVDRAEVIAVGDIDADGDVDVAGWINLAGDDELVYLANDGTGSLTLAARWQLSPWLNFDSMEIGDVNGDQHPDIVSTRMLLSRW